MQNFQALEPAIDPNNRITFLLDWEVTMKCNLDCSYCSTGINGSHDNSTRHPPLAECLQSIDFMFEYVDRYMHQRRKAFKHVVLNVYGGESLHHPHIVEILQQIRKKYQKYQGRWSLKVTCTTNAIVARKKLLSIVDLVDEFTASYHSEASDKNKLLFKQNLLDISASGKDLKCVVLMHADTVLFEDSQSMISWLLANNIRHIPKQLDHHVQDTQFNYTKNQVVWFKDVYHNLTFNKSNQELETKKDHDGNHDLAASGRACCGGRQLCLNQNYKTRDYFVQNNFRDWYCSVNQFFLFVKQINGNVYVNKDCKMRFDGSVGPIGNLKYSKEILQQLDHDLNHGMPVIKCAKSRCMCGLCAPKARDLDTYNQIMKNYQACDI